MFYIFFGLIVGPVGLGFIHLRVGAVELRVIADLTLALVLFIDAANADLTTSTRSPWTGSRSEARPSARSRAAASPPR